MGISDGKKATEAIRAFNESNAGGGEEIAVISRLANVLQTRSFGEKHFKQAQAYFQGMRDAAQVKSIDEYSYDEYQAISKRQLKLFMCYMGIQTEEDGTTHEDQFIPTMLRGMMTENLLSLSQRPLPIILSSEHAEYRFVQRTGKALDYNSREFQWTTATGTMLAVTQASLLSASNPVMPTVLPDADGLYLGHAVGCTLESYYPTNFVLAARNKETGKPVLHGLEKGCKVITKPEWSPQSYSNILTFVSRAELYPDQQEFWEQFREVFSGPAIEDAYTTLMNNYISCMPLKNNEVQQISSLFDKSKRVIDGKLWKQVNKRSKSHVPTIELH